MTIIGEKFWYAMGFIAVLCAYAYLSNMDYNTELVQGHVDGTTVVKGTWETNAEHYVLTTSSGKSIIMDEFDPPEYENNTPVVAVFDKNGLVYIEERR